VKVKGVKTVVSEKPFGWSDPKKRSETYKNVEVAIRGGDSVSYPKAGKLEPSNRG